MEKAGTGIKRVKDACKANGNKCNYRFTDAFWIEMITNDTTSQIQDKNKPSKSEGVNEGVNVGVNVGVNEVLEIIKNNPGVNTIGILRYFDVTPRTVERWIKELRENNKIEFRGAPKTGGYYVIEKQ